MPAVVIVMFALGVMVIESVLLQAFSIQTLTFQTPLVVAIVVGLDREFVSGGLILATLLFPIEWLVGGVFGAYSLGLVAVFFAMRSLRPNLQALWGLARGVVAAVAALCHGVWMLVVLRVTGVSAGGLDIGVAWRTVLAAVVVAVTAVVVGKTFARFDQMMDPHRRHSGLEL